jgi:hypothetical protein
MSNIFAGARLKIERADEHIASLERDFRSFVAAQPPRPNISTNPATRETSFGVRFDPQLPARFALILGDAIHNLRTSLDHMTWELVGIDGGTQGDRLQFPGSKDETSFEKACARINTPSQAVRDALRSLAVFPSGRGEQLYRLHQLDIAEKHRILTPIVHETTLSNVTARTPTASVSIGSMTGGSMIAAGMWQLDSQPTASVEMVFGKVDGVESEPVIKTLRGLRAAVVRTLDEMHLAVSRGVPPKMTRGA